PHHATLDLTDRCRARISDQMAATTRNLAWRGQNRPGRALIRHYSTADEIRDAEAPLLASLPEGGLMRRAAFGLATAIIRELVRLTGAISGSRVCAVVGSGDNGGDALWAATFLRRRGVAAAAVLLNPERTHKAALAAFTRAGGRVLKAFRRQPIW